MATKRQRSNGTWEYCFQRKGVLQSRVYFTFDTEEEGDAYAARVEPLLARGVVPAEFTGTAIRTLADLCAHYEAMATYSQSDAEVLKPLQKSLEGVAMTRLTYSWVEDWVETMKASLKPSTLTKRVGLLARVVDWGLRRELINLANNPIMARSAKFPCRACFTGCWKNIWPHANRITPVSFLGANSPY